MKEFIKNNSKVISLLVIVILLSAIGLTFAYTMDNINVAIGTGEYNVVYTGTSSLPTSSLEPILDSELLSTSNADKIMKITFTVKGAQTNPTERDIIYDVSLTDLNLPEGLKSKFLKWRLYKNNTQLSEGNFSKEFDAQANNRMVLTDIQQDLPDFNSTPDSYTFYVWITQSCTGDVTTCTEEQDLSDLVNKTFSGKIRIELSVGSKKPLSRPIYVNAPDLANNSLIPIMYNETTSSWVKADENNTNESWYNYNEKKWANAVLVTDANRALYQEASVGTPIEESDILAYYVWIPRYKYKVWNINKEVGTDTYDAYTKGIDIVFEVGGATTGTITCDSYSYAAPVATKGEPNEICFDNGTSGYYTHPAFTFGTDELSGFWMGKFELSSTDQTAANYGGGNKTTLTPRILPDVMSWRYNTVGNFWKVIYDMQTSNNIYGLPTDRTTVDSHMLTNMEWGAVAYLTHSKYGRCTGGENSTCTEVAKNNSGEDSYKTNYTGRSSGVGGSSGYTAAGTYTYKEEGGQLASTTGNIYGVYDMSGGADEFVMGNTGTSAGQTTGEYKYYASSAGSNYPYAGFEKYLTPYAYGTTNSDQAAYNRGRLGDATSEVVRSTGGSGGWHGDYAIFPYSSYSWFLRGGYFGFSTSAGPFSFYSVCDGGGSRSYSARASLVLVAS